MSESDIFELPGQPTTGSSKFVPLGGDGFYSPSYAYHVSMSIAGSAGGGFARCGINADPRFTSIVSHVTFLIEQATAGDADFQYSIGDMVAEAGVLTATSLTISSFGISKVFRPPPVLWAGGEGDMAVKYLNVDANTFYLQALIYLFDIRARETTALGPLLWSKGSS